MLNRAVFDSCDFEEKSPITSAIYSLGQCVISNYLRTFASFIEYMYADASKSMWDLFGPWNSQEAPSKSEAWRDKFTKPGDISLVIETLILGNSCLFHRGEHLVGIVCERWIIRHTMDSSKTGEHMTWGNLLSEIDTYFKSSPLSFWLKEHFQSTPYKITHRVCNAEAIQTQLGVPFRTTLSELSECHTARGQAEIKYCHTRCDSPLKSEFYDCQNVYRHRRHDFLPITLGTDGLITLSVLSPERMPPAIPACVLCTADRQLHISQQKVIDDDSLSGQTESLLEIHAQPVQTSVNPSDEVLVSLNSEISMQTHQSPVLVTTTASDYLTSDPADFPSESATSTLTKKPRSLKIAEEANQPQLGSPPRKQQRMSDLTSTSREGIVRCLAENNCDRIGSLDKVIADFTQLNVELPDPLDPEDKRLFSPGETTPNSIVLSPLLGSSNGPHNDREVGETLKPTVASEECLPNEGSLVTLSRSLFSTHGVSHWPKERRRNATSACIPNSSSHSDNFVAFNRRTGLPLQSSPVPLKRSTSGRFDFDSSLNHLKPAKSSACMMQTFYPPTNIPVQSAAPDTRSTTNDQATRPTSTAQPRRRRRPASLRLNPVERNTGSNLFSPPAQTGPYRSRPPYVSELDHQAELSCSAPPSGERNLLHSGMSRERMVNTLACTPVSYGSSQHLLVNFEESMLNGRIHPVGQVDGFTLELGASGSFFPSHERLPLTTYFFDLSDDNKPSPYLGYADLSHLRNGKGYLIPMKGSVQLTLFNPNKFVVKMFVIGYDFEDMPPNSQTFLRQRTVYMPVRPTPSSNPYKTNFYCGSTTSLNDLPDKERSDDRLSVPDIFWSSSKPSSSRATGLSSSALSCSCSSLSSICSSACSIASNQIGNSMTSRLEQQPAFLRYLVHLRFHTTRSGRLYLHTDLRLIFARDKFEFDPRVATYELRSFIDAPTNPRYSPKKWTKRSKLPANSRVNSRVTTP